MKLAIVTPWTSPFMWTSYVDAMLDLERPAEIRNPYALGRAEPLEVRFFRGAGWCPAKRHLNGVMRGLEWGADLICIVGADQVHPPDMLRRLVARWEQGCEVIAALVPARAFIGWQDMRPFQPMAWRLKASSSVDLAALNDLASLKNEVEVIDPRDGELQQINFIGSGVLMFHRDHLAAMKRPWFSESFDPETLERTASMDTRFVWALQVEAGATCWVDTTILVGHLHPFAIDRSYQDRFADWAQPGVGDPVLCRFPSPDAAAAPAIPETAVV